MEENKHPAVFKKDKREDLENYRLVNLFSLTQKVVAKILSETFPRGNMYKHEGQEGDQETSDWIYEGDIMLNQPHRLLQ